jgi:hypothetical protein
MFGALCQLTDPWSPCTPFKWVEFVHAKCLTNVAPRQRRTPRVHLQSLVCILLLSPLAEIGPSTFCVYVQNDVGREDLKSHLVTLRVDSSNLLFLIILGERTRL